MKKLLITLLAFGSYSAFAEFSKNCHVECEYEGFPGVGSLVEASVGQVMYMNNRIYGTWTKSCQVLTSEGKSFYKNKISGAEVTNVWSSEQRRDGHYEGRRLDERRQKKEEVQEEKLAIKVKECNQH